MKNERYVPFLVEMWNDDWFLDLEPDEKLVWINLYHSNLTNDIGIFPPNKQIRCMQSSVTPKRWMEILDKFENQHKIEISAVTGEIAINHYLIDHATHISPISCPKLYKEFWQVKDCDFARKKMKESLEYYLSTEDVRGKQNKSGKPSSLERFLDYAASGRDLTPEEKHDIYRTKIDQEDADPLPKKKADRNTYPSTRSTYDDEYDFSKVKNPFDPPDDL